MWFISKKNTSKRKRRNIPFLRKPLPKKRERCIAEEKKHKQPSRFIIFFLWILLCSTFFYIVLFSSFTCLEVIEVLGTNNVSSEYIQRSVRDQLSGKYFSIFPRCALILVRPKLIEEELHREYPLLKEIFVQRIFPDKIHITVSEHQYILLWKVGDMIYLIDEEGKARDATFALSDENKPFFLILSDVSGKSLSLGEKVVEPEYREFLFLLSKSFSQRTEGTLSTTFTIVSRFADELRGTTSDGYEIYFNTKIPLETSFDTLSLLLEKELTLKKRRSDIQYIDLRTENRVYYAFRDDKDQESSLFVSPSLSEETIEKKK